MSEILIDIEFAKISEHAQMSEIENFRTLRKSLIFDESLKKFAAAKGIYYYGGDF